MSFSPYPTLVLKITPPASLRLKTSAPAGAAGAAGVGVPVGGTTGQVLTKVSATDFNTSWQSPAGGGGITDGDKGDITVSGVGTIWTIDNQVVTYAKMQNVSATARFLGRKTAGAGSTEELSGADAKTVIGSGDLTKVDDTNVTLALGGTPTAALYSAVSLTLGWTGTLSVARGGTGAGSFTAFAVLCGGTTSTSPVQAIGSVGTAGQVLTSNGAGALPTFQAAGAATGTPVPPQGRLTLQTLVPVMVTTQASKTTLFYTPYNGSVVPLYNGSSFAMTAFTEIQVQTTDTTKSPAAIGASKVNDWFVWSDGGTIRLGHGPDWTNDTTRSAGTALVMVNGILLNNASITNGPAASRGTYVGTTRSDASSQLNWILGAAASGGTAAVLGVWNAYNRVDVGTTVLDSGTQYTYSSGTIRQARGGAGNQISFVLGLQEDAVIATMTAKITLTGAASAFILIAPGLDTTTAFSSQPVQVYSPLAAAFIWAPSTTAIFNPSIGFHFISRNEQGDAANNNTLNGSNVDFIAASLRM